MLRFVARPLLAAIFIHGGIDSARRPESKLGRALPVTGPIVDRLPVTLDSAQLVRVNGVAQVAGGVALAIGVVPRLAAFGLAVSLVPTTIAGHAFWAEKDADARRTQTVQFLKNAAMLGGLLMVIDAG